MRSQRDGFTSMSERHQAPGGGNTSPARWRILNGFPGTTIVFVVVALATIAGMTGASGASQTGTPVATPAASPIASPVARPIATYPVTQIIVGKITIEMTANGFGPTYFESAVGRDITITVVNHDSELHNFTIEKLDIDVDVQPGESKVIEIELPTLGTYRFYSNLPGDEDMEGSFSVFI